VVKISITVVAAITVVVITAAAAATLKRVLSKCWVS